MNLQTLKARAKAYEEEAQEAPIGERVKNSGYTYPKGQCPIRATSNEMASHLWYTKHRGNNPIYDQAVVNQMVKRRLAAPLQYAARRWRLGLVARFELCSDEYMSAYVM